MTARNLARKGRHLFLFVLVLAFVGCGAKPGSISGKVLFKGSPLPSGRVVFICDGGEKPVLMADIVEGVYSIPAAPVGDCKITVATYETKVTAVPNMPKDAASPPGGGPKQTGKYVAIPAKYGDPAQSGLTYRIQSGEQVKDIDLK
jgi:hypothetical protein